MALGLLGMGAADVAHGSEECPDPKTCSSFATTPIRQHELKWEVNGDGTTRFIPYYINPTQDWVSEEEAVGAIVAAFETWNAVVPAIQFEFAGTTALLPVSGDRINVVGFVDTYAWRGTHAATAVWQNGPQGQIWEMDTTFSPGYAWSWTPCEKRDGSCTPIPKADWLTRWHRTQEIWPFCCGVQTLVEKDIEHVMTHEVGHWLGLAHPGPEASLMTMRSGDDDYDIHRHKVTLGLGDVLGARHLYPCDCPMPEIYSP